MAEIGRPRIFTVRGRFIIIMVINQKILRDYFHAIAEIQPNTLPPLQEMEMAVYQNLLYYGSGETYEIANRMGIECSRVSGRITKLKEKGYVTAVKIYRHPDTNRNRQIWGAIMAVG